MTNWKIFGLLRKISLSSEFDKQISKTDFRFLLLLKNHEISNIAKNTQILHQNETIKVSFFNHSLLEFIQGKKFWERGEKGQIFIVIEICQFQVH